jgi:hypothetical protein
MEIKGISSGQRVRVTSLQAARGWIGRRLVTVAAGQVYDGVVQDLNTDGFFELQQDSGERQHFNAYDMSISIVGL